VGSRLHLLLEDNGAGMDPEVLRRACDPFFSTKSAGRSRGLGLSIAFSLAKQMGGSLALHSLLGEGTRAELELPLGAPSLPLPALPPPSSLARRILLADDETGIRELVEDILRQKGFDVTTASDGREALDRFEAEPEAWDLVILDLVMPRLHGSDVLAQIQARRPNLPALLMSGYSEQARPGLLDGPHRRFLAKPFRIHELMEALEALGLHA
jgi:CheY-like chemotaxis protein